MNQNSFTERLNREAVSFDNQVRNIIYNSYGSIVDDLEFDYIKASKEKGRLAIGRSNVYLRGGFETELYVNAFYTAEGEYGTRYVLNVLFEVLLPRKSRFKKRNGKLIWREVTLHKDSPYLKNAYLERKKFQEE